MSMLSQTSSFSRQHHFLPAMRAGGVIEQSGRLPLRLDGMTSPFGAPVWSAVIGVWETRSAHGRHAGPANS